MELDKVYIQVYDLLINHGVPFNELMELVKSNKLQLYCMNAPYEYKQIDSFECFVDDYIARKRTRIERNYNRNITNSCYPNERTAHILSLSNTIYQRYAGQKITRIADTRRIAHDNVLKALEDRERVEKELVVYLYVKSCDYEKAANSCKSPRKKGKTPDILIKETRDSCQFVEKVYGPDLMNKPKDDVCNLVKAQMKYKNPHRATFNEWYTKCHYTRKAGNPNFCKKPA